MDKLLKTFTNQLTEFWKSKDKQFKRNLAVISVILLAAIIAFTVFISRTEYAVLYANLDLQDAGEILDVLGEMKVAAKPQDNGTILVPRAIVDRLRMEMASKGYPKSGFDLDIIKMGAGIGVTEEDKRVYRQYQLQQHIQNAIKTIAGVHDARVIITLPEETSFVLSDDTREATAAILLTLSADNDLSSKNIKAIAEFVQKGVPGLKPENVSIIDNNMNILDFNMADGGYDLTDKYALQCSVEDRLEKQVMDLLQPIFGMGKVYSKVSVKLDFDEKVIDSQKYEPLADGTEGIMVSIDRLREDIKNGSGSGQAVSGADAGQAVTDTGAGLDSITSGSDSGTVSYPVMSTDDSVYMKNAETINYEVNSIKEHIVKEKGRIESMTVSVIVDNAVGSDYTEGIRNLVAAAAGIGKESVAVEYMPFAGSRQVSDIVKSQNESADRINDAEQIRYFVTFGAMVLIMIVALFLLFRTLVIKQGGKSKKRNGSQSISSAQMVIEAIAANGTGFMDMHEDGKQEKIGELINSNAELVANILRSWITDEKEPHA